MPSRDEPFRDEIIDDGEFQELVDLLCTRTSMWVHPPDAETVLAFIQGYEHARNAGPLVGFKQWLVVRQNGGNNLHWSGLVLDAAETVEIECKDSETDPRLPKLNILFKEFFEYRRSNGVTKIFANYADWLLRQSWYTGPLRRK